MGEGGGRNGQRAQVPHKYARWTNVVPYCLGDTYASCGAVGSAIESSLVTVTVTATVIGATTEGKRRVCGLCGEVGRLKHNLTACLLYKGCIYWSRGHMCIMWHG